MRTCVPPCGWGLGVLLCAALVFSQRREGRAEARYDAVGDLLAGYGVYCRPGAAWDLLRWFVCRVPYSSPLPGAVAPHPSSFSCVCVFLCRGGVSCGGLPVFLLVFHGEFGQIW